MNPLLAFLSRFPVWVLLMLSAAAVITGDYFAKYWSLHQKTVFFAIALVGYLLSGMFYIPVLRKEGLVISALIWILLNTIGFVTIGVVIFKESLTPLQTLGVITGTISLILLSL